MSRRTRWTAIGCAIVLTGLTVATFTSGASAATDPGQGTALAQTQKIDPKAGGLSLGFTFGMHVLEFPFLQPPINRHRRVFYLEPVVAHAAGTVRRCEAGLGVERPDRAAAAARDGRRRPHEVPSEPDRDAAGGSEGTS